MNEVIPDPNINPAPAPERTIVVRIKNWYTSLPDKKRYAEFFSAILTIPVLITVIILNINSLNSQKANKSAIPTPATTIITIIQPTATPSATIAAPTPLAKPDPAPQDTPTATPTPLPTATPTPTPTATPTPAASQSGTLQ